MFRELQLTAALSSWHQFDARKTSKRYDALAEPVFSRDNSTCQFCGFQASTHMEVINLDGNYKNNEFENLVTACPLCGQCHFLEQVGQGEIGGGTLIYLPELSGGQLNGLCHVLFCAMSNASSYYADAQNIYRELKLRSQLVEKQFGEGLSDPAVFGRALLDSHVENTRGKGLALLKHVRLLPSRSRFKTLVDDWAKTAAGSIA